MATTQEPVKLREPIAADASELAALRSLAALLADEAARPLVLAGGEREATLPPTVLSLLRLLTEELARERAVRLETFGQEVTIWEAADILGVSIEGVRQFAADGAFPTTEAPTGEAVSLTLIPLRDLLAYQAARATRQTEAINELLRLSEEFGLYDWDIGVEDDQPDEDSGDCVADCDAPRTPREQG